MVETEAETMSTGTMEGALNSVSSQVSEAFGRLTHLQDELRARLNAVAERERGAEETTRVLDELGKRLEAREQELRNLEAQLHARVAELDRRAAEIEENHRHRQAHSDERDAGLREREAKCDAWTVRLDEREARLTRRQDVVDAFQEMLAQMHTALETLDPDNIMAALDAGTTYEDCAKSVLTARADCRTEDPEGPPAKDPIGLTPAEQARFFALRDAGKSDAEILAEIYEARAKSATTTTVSN
jgi:chromosome segregation ATPase